MASCKKVKTSGKKSGKAKFRVQYKSFRPDGSIHQTSKTFHSEKEAKAFAAEAQVAENKFGGWKKETASLLKTAPEENGEMTLNEFVKQDYFPIHGGEWQPSTYTNKTSLFENYITNFLGSFNLSEISSRMVDNYYNELRKMDAVQLPGHPLKKITERTIIEIHRSLRSIFNYARLRRYVTENPLDFVTPPKHKDAVRAMWTYKQFKLAVETAQNNDFPPEFWMAMVLSFYASLRLGEVTGLKWDDVSLEEDGLGVLSIDKELARVKLETLENLHSLEHLEFLPGQLAKADRKTVQVLKPPKTAASVRKVYISAEIYSMLMDYKQKQDKNKAALGEEYYPISFVIAQSNGAPCDSNYIMSWMRRLYKVCPELPHVTFHSIRHLSITEKLKAFDGDIKAVQGDSGHATTKMVTERYAHIMDEDRRAGVARLASYLKEHDGTDTSDATSIVSALQKNPELMKAVLKELGQSSQ